jgi:hypothetical protein
MTNIEDDVLALNDDGIGEVIDDALNYARAMRFIAESDLIRDDTAPGCAFRLVPRWRVVDERPGRRTKH